MIKVRNYVFYLFITISTFLFASLSLSAAHATYTVTGDSSVYVGNNFTVRVQVSNISTPFNSIGGTLSYDNSLLEIVSVTGMTSPVYISYNSSSRNFTGMYPAGFQESGTLLTITFKALRTGNATVSVTGAEQGSSLKGGGSPSISVNAKTISITNPPSSNANLSSLSISNGSISFSPSTTSYNVRVGKDVSSVNVSATAEDGGARVSGTGNKSLNYGSNSVSITVTAPSGATKTYTINITREDPRSGNANLSSLKVDGGEISPAFNKNTTVYEVNVPFSVENLNVKASAEDGKARVSVSGAEGLIAEGTKDVNVTVTAENGARKTYTIKVTRGKDPNKVLSTNNYLSSLTTNQGILSPTFDKDKINYIIYLPYEIENIELNATVEDTKYGVLTKDGPEKLLVGSNKYTFTVAAEDNSTKVYTVIVMRGASLDENQDVPSGVLLKEININKGSLDKPFKSSVNVYRYDKSKGFKVNPVPEDEKSKVTVLEYDDVISIIVESETDTNVYTLVPEEKSNLGIIIATAVIGGSLTVGGSFLGFKIGLKKTPKVKIKKEKAKIKDLTNSDNSFKEEKNNDLSNKNEILKDKDPFIKNDNISDNKFM